MNQDHHGRSWIYALGGVALLAASVIGFSVVPAGCSPTSQTPTIVPTKGTKGTKETKPPKVASVEPALTTPAEDGASLKPTDESAPPSKKPRIGFRDRSSSGPKEAVPVPEDSTRELHEPVVAMTKAHADTCVVKVGDPFPELKLAELEGSDEELAKLRGEKLTVVVFWNLKKVYAAEQFARLKSDVTAAYGKFGVAVVAINVGDPPEAVAKFARQHEIDFACLLDPSGEAFNLVAKEKLPRTYLLDAQGKVLWLDLEYSQTTRSELKNAVFYFLKKDAG